ncbi:MAG: hydrogenase expression/formation protein HypE [Candidatus Woesearchaeota archaeon]
MKKNTNNIDYQKDEFVSLTEGSGGKEMQFLISSIRKNLGNFKNKWQGYDEDSAYINIGNNKNVVFTTDSYTISPIFFPGGNIGDIAFCGTVNDLSVMGAKPIGLSLGIIIEEGFLKNDLKKIINSISKLSKKFKIPIVTGDTKVVEKKSLDKIIINTSGIGIANNKNILNNELKIGDKIILSGGIGEHSIALLSKRLDFETSIITDSKALINELLEINSLIKQAKDATRGGIASTLNELCEKNKIGMVLNEENIPVKKEVKIVCEMLGLNVYELACEGRFICVCNKKNSTKTLSILKKYNKMASIIGEVTKDNKIIIKTELGTKILNNPTGRIVPRIC